MTQKQKDETVKKYTEDLEAAEDQVTKAYAAEAAAFTTAQAEPSTGRRLELLRSQASALDAVKARDFAQMVLSACRNAPVDPPAPEIPVTEPEKPTEQPAPAAEAPAAVEPEKPAEAAAESAEPAPAPEEQPAPVQ